MSIQLVAAASMYLDHWAVHVDSTLTVFRHIGRLAAVYFLIHAGIGLSKTSDSKKYGLRLLLCALSFTFVHGVLGYGVSLNVVYIMALSAFFLDTRCSWLLPVFVLPFDYSIFALCLIMAARYQNLFLGALSLIALNGVGLVSILTLYYGYLVWIFRDELRSGPRYWLYYFYPAHLLFMPNRFL